MKRCGGKIYDITDWAGDESLTQTREGGLFRWFNKNLKKKEPRRTMCEMLRTWLFELEKIGVKIDVLIGGVFSSDDPTPAHIDVMVVSREDLDEKNETVQEKVKFLVDNKEYVLKTYRVWVVKMCSMLGPRSVANEKELYNDALEQLEDDKYEEHKPTIYRVCL